MIPERRKAKISGMRTIPVERDYENFRGEGFEFGFQGGLSLENGTVRSKIAEI